ncbi:MAG: cation:proton antiporter [Planctomycetota bacterium]|nr:cation:proton antiporter [Planctomycetota bacterium]
MLRPMPEHGILRDLVVVLAAAILGVMLLHRLRLPAIAGLLLAGACVGPTGLGLIEDADAVARLAEIGVALLLFTIGLEFSLSGLRRIAWMVGVGGALQVGLTLLATFAIARLAGFEAERAVFAGFLVALSSTAIVLRSLSEHGETDAPHGKLIVGVLLFQDLCVVPMMLVVPMLAEGRAHPGAILRALAEAGAVVVATVVLARFILPRAFRLVARTQRRDVFLLAALLVGAGIGWATSAAGLSLALGAFLAGLVLADSEYGHQALADVLPLRDLFTSLFFVSIGMLLDLDVLRAEWLAVTLVAVGLLAGKFLVASLAGLVLRLPLRVALLSGAALAQIGEFSFVLAGAGAERGLLNPRELAIFLDASVLTMLVTPLVSLAGPWLVASAGKLEKFDTFLHARHAPEEARAARHGHTVVLGFGVGGELLARALEAAGLDYVLVDLDVERVRSARERGSPVTFGDVTRPEILEQAGVCEAAQVALLVNDPQATLAAVRAIRRLSTRVPITVRARYLRDAPLLRAAGATHVVAQEVEASLHVTADVLERLERTPEQVEELLRRARAQLGSD